LNGVKRYHGGMKDRNQVAFILAVALAGVGLASFIYVPLLESQRHPDSSTSAKNLAEIGDMLQQYANDNAGRYPDSFSTLYLHEPIAAVAFIYPGRSETEAVGDRAEVARELADPRHCSYIFMGAGLKPPLDPQRVVAMERMSDGQETVNVLLACGLVQNVDREEAMKILKDPMEIAQSSIKPTTEPASRPATGP